MDPYSKPLSPVAFFNNVCLHQYTAQDIQGVFDFSFNPVPIQDSCSVGVPETAVVFSVTAIDDDTITFHFDAFPYVNPSTGNGELSNNHVTGSIADSQVSYQFPFEFDSPIKGCTVDSTFTIEFDIVGPGQVENVIAIFSVTNIQGDCTLQGGSCISEFTADIV